ncbi:MAG: PilZ domain-containing protein [Lachnospiraceae bacterium]|nr:PilZ domain-containing protein [Lachnospiraceae bacterium]
MPQINKWRKASIYGLEKTYICDVQVEMISDTITLVFPEEIQNGAWENVNIVFYDDKKGLVTYKCKLHDYKLRSERLTAQCILGEEESVVQRRNDLKIRQIIPISIQAFNSTTGEKMNVNGTIQDISAGGIFFISETLFDEGERFSFLFRRTAEPMRLECEVLRKQPYTGRGNYVPGTMMGYGCRFVNMNDHKESAVRSYVFKEDLLARKREREMEAMFGR